MRGYVCCGHGGANGSAGTSGVPEYRQGCSADAALRPSPALVQQCQAEALAHGEPMARASCIQGGCTGEANQFCKLFQQALLGQPRFTVMVLWSGHISVKPHLLQGCISFSFAFPSCGGVGGCVHFLLVLLVVHLPGTKNIEVSRNEQVFPKRGLKALNSKDDGTGHCNDVFIPVLSLPLLEVS